MAAGGVGQAAEAAVVDELKSQGYKILDRNWKTKVCEIDIVAKRDEILYFVEVKYRANLSQGGGWEYITPRKLNQLRFAARHWNQKYGWDGDYRIVGAEVSGSNFDDVKTTEID